jgi:hypothetical protein
MLYLDSVHVFDAESSESVVNRDLDWLQVLKLCKQSVRSRNFLPSIVQFASCVVGRSVNDVCYH